MIIFEVEVNGEIVATMKPEVQRLREIMGWMFDRVDELQAKHGDNFKIHRKVLV